MPSSQSVWKYIHTVVEALPFVVVALILCAWGFTSRSLNCIFRPRKETNKHRGGKPGKAGKRGKYSKLNVNSSGQKESGIHEERKAQKERCNIINDILSRISGRYFNNLQEAEISSEKSTMTRESRKSKRDKKSRGKEKKNAGKKNDKSATQSDRRKNKNHFLKCGSNGTLSDDENLDLMDGGRIGTIHEKGYAYSNAVYDKTDKHNHNDEGSKPEITERLVCGPPGARTKQQTEDRHNDDKEPIKDGDYSKKKSADIEELKRQSEVTNGHLQTYKSELNPCYTDVRKKVQPQDNWEYCWSKGREQSHINGRQEYPVKVQIVTSDDKRGNVTMGEQRRTKENHENIHHQRDSITESSSTVSTDNAYDGEGKMVENAKNKEALEMKMTEDNIYENIGLCRMNVEEKRMKHDVPSTEMILKKDVRKFIDNEIPQTGNRRKQNGQQDSKTSNYHVTISTSAGRFRAKEKNDNEMKRNEDQYRESVAKCKENDTFMDWKLKEKFVNPRNEQQENKTPAIGFTPKILKVGLGETPAVNILPSSYSPRRTESITVPLSIDEYAAKEWKGGTPKADKIKRGYNKVKQVTGFSFMRQVRGDNYCALRAVMFKALSSGMDILDKMGKVENISKLPNQLMAEDLTWLQNWNFANRLRSPTASVTDTLTKCLNYLQALVKRCTSCLYDTERYKMVLDVMNGKEEDEIMIFEAVKFLMLYSSIQLYNSILNGGQHNSWEPLLFARDTSLNPESFMENHLNHVGDLGGLDQLEMMLLGQTLNITIRIFRLHRVDEDDFMLEFPVDLEDQGSIDLIAEDDRHYNVLAEEP